MTPKSLLTVGVVALLGLSACGSSAKISLPSKTSSGSSASTPAGSGNTLPLGLGTIPGGTIPNISGVSGDCMALVQAMAGAFTGQGTGSLDGLPAALDKIAAKAPAELQGDFKTMAKGYAALASLYKKYNNDFTKIATDPEATKLFSDSSFTEASTRVSAYMDKQCPSK